MIDVWSIETSTIIARGRKYARALLDEIAFVKTDMGLLWRASISPTLIDLDGFESWRRRHGGPIRRIGFFRSATTSRSVGPSFMRDAKKIRSCLARVWRRRNAATPLVWRQEFEAEFTSLDAAALIDVTKLLQADGEPWPEPERLDLVFVVIDSAIKTGASANGTAALFCAVTGQHPT